ncbi:DUF222 domain-containing protein [Arthrobacter sp. NPDC090010]|uniref:HNH endonuclease signature motif containing protein n=1 Tax=Arthrobacter sp. NPDC090010 TaxID=3363942 RepID=UPI0038079503
MEAESGVREGAIREGYVREGRAVPDPESLLAGLVSSLVGIESALASLQAVREYTLAMAFRLAEVMTAEEDGGAPGLWDSRAAELAQRSVAAELAVATRASDRTLQRQMTTAAELLDGFPALFHAMLEGRLGRAQARVVQENGAVIVDPAARARYEEAVLALAETQTPGRLRRLAAREAEKAQRLPLSQRHERARAERRIWLNPLPDGMAELGALLPSAVAHGVFDRLTRMAERCPGTGSGPGADVGSDASDDADGGEPCPRTELRSLNQSRSRDQLRADLFADLLLRGAPSGHDAPEGLLAGIGARVEVTVPVLTLIDADDSVTEGSAMSGEPAELNGRHPIDPDTARILAGQEDGWNRVLTDPITGAVLAVDRYRPGEALRRMLRARDSRCRFPGCAVRAARLDLDHTLDAAFGGPTEVANLAGLCRRHHVLKHHGGWKLGQSGGGVLEWMSPLGLRYTDHPPVPAGSVACQTGPHPPIRSGSRSDPDPPPF